ncbi:hypothetical protein [Streptomyces candidus]|uniref:Uncharacterized protein n=1 Tax=Streptomyces candidus TaxID=67283 RepID=A0A7X0HM05_9ACTN|nr:hypothetical protein [Streptomyces candidus]MBB6439985.1 hypothetical protein [Streptomyces candidus]GHH57468.1 hypothetical protein GCM10018773_64860 [Streptomyces candidus]
MAVSRTRKKKNQKRTNPVWEGRAVWCLGEEGVADGGPSRRNIAVGHRAAEADRVWFNRNIGASVRVREALRGEYDHRAFGSEPFMPNQKIAVVVVQVAPGRRSRIPFQVVTTPTASTRITPQQLEEVRAEWESSGQSVPMNSSGGTVVDVLAMFRHTMGAELSKG